MNTPASTQKWFAFALSALLFGCSSGGSGGDAEPNPVNNAELEGETPQSAPVETGVDSMVIGQPAPTWVACEVSDQLECASIVVPMDYSNPEGNTIEIMMARFNNDGAQRARTLFMNPGGPGGGGLSFLNSIERFGDVSDAMRNEFNFVSFEPRGLGLSTPIDCDQTDLFTQDNYPVNFEELTFNYNKAIEFAQSCSQTTGEFLQHVGSHNVVRDINEMRKALNLTEIDFLGYSYGTRLAALYLQTFPESSGRFILDGSMAPGPEVATLAQGSLLPAQANINAIAQACVDDLCEPADFLARLNARVAVLGAGPTTLESSLLGIILIHGATKPGFETVLVGGLSRYLNSEDIRELEFIDRRLGISEALEDRDINNATFYSVMCADDPTRPSLEEIEALRETYNIDSDLFAESYLGTAGLCFGWPAALNPIPQIATNQAPAALVIGGPTDAQTPLIFSEQMAQALGGQFLRSEHKGHVTVFTGRNQCTQEAADEFLLTGNLPAVSVCAEGTSNAIAAARSEQVMQQLH